ncbi:Crp/Fnr family transcriptional regulator [Oscillatoriales cyanobacterium USR001]|nr:Crp/Fnr family transcriptional regulator [Oscillatoriales cyanobacterium USR001]
MSVTPLLSIRPSEISKHQFSRRSLLPNSQLFLWQIETGVVRTLTWLEDGSPVPLGMWGPGDVVGKIMSNCDPYQIECLTKVEAIPLPTETWYNARDVLLDHLQQAEDFMLIRGYRKVDAMLFHLLAWLAKKFGSQVKNGQLIDLGLTHQDIAEILGTTRVTITRALNNFEQKGIINRLSVHRIVLHNVEFLDYQI